MLNAVCWMCSSVADWFVIPDTQSLLDFVRPDFLLLRVCHFFARIFCTGRVCFLYAEMHNRLIVTVGIDCSRMLVYLCTGFSNCLQFKRCCKEISFLSHAPFFLRHCEGWNMAAIIQAVWCQYDVLLVVMLYWVIESVVMFLCNVGSGALSQSYHVEFSYSVGSMDKQQSTSCMSPVVHSLSAFVCCFCTNLVFLFCFFKNYFRRLVSFLHQDKVHRFWSLTVFNTHV